MSIQCAHIIQIMLHVLSKMDVVRLLFKTVFVPISTTALHVYELNCQKQIESKTECWVKLDTGKALNNGKCQMQTYRNQQSQLPPCRYVSAFIIIAIMVHDLRITGCGYFLVLSLISSNLSKSLFLI